MVKSSGTTGGPAGRLTGGRNSSAIVDVVQRRSADRLAKIAFIVTWATLAPTVFVAAASVTSWWIAAAIGIIAGLVVAGLAWLVALVWPVLRMLWWWTTEITLLALLLSAYWGLTRVVPWWAAVMVLSMVLGLPLVLPGSRRLLAAWAWCGISRHRLRTCFATFIRVNRRGSLPLILWARPTPAGERVWIVLRPGLSLDDLTTEGGLSRLAVGCWAHEVRLSRAWRRFAPAVRVDITRRNPLSGMVTSPLTVSGARPVRRPGPGRHVYRCAGGVRPGRTGPARRPRPGYDRHTRNNQPGRLPGLLGFGVDSRQAGSASSYRNRHHAFPCSCPVGCAGHHYCCHPHWGGSVRVGLATRSAARHLLRAAWFAT